MKPKSLTAAFLAATALASSLFAQGGIAVSDVTYFQTEQRDMVVNYRLTGDESAVVTIDILTNGVSIGAQNFTHLSGAVNTIVAPSATATNRIYWRARKDWPNHKIDSGVTVKVNAWALTNPPDYFVLDLETGDKKWYASVDALPDGGLANDVYKTTKLVMRRIPAGGETFTMGYPTNDAYLATIYSYYLGKGAMPPHSVSLTDDFYMAIYETTAKQYATVWPSQSNLESGEYHQDEKHPRAYVPTANIRGSDKYWPRDGHEVQDSPNRFIKLIRGIAGGVMLDLPTEAQWEFACRAGSTTAWSGGLSWYGSAGSNEASVGIDGRAACSQYMWTSEYSGNTTHEVGLLKPNAFGLYDMHGNVAETCLDVWAAGSSVSDGSAVVDPVGPGASSGSGYRVVKGGGYSSARADSRSDSRTTTSKATSLDANVGFRLVCPAVAQ